MEAASEQHSFTVRELLQTANSLLKEIFAPEIWVEGQIANYSESRNGHAYFTLTEELTEPGQDHNYELRIALFRRNLQSAKNLLERSGLEIKNGVAVKIGGSVGIYEKQGQFQMVMTKIDPRFTLEKTILDRKALLRKLEALQGINASRELSPLPLHVGLVTSHNSAACHDFCDQLTKSGIGWRIDIADTAVQGDVAPESIAAAIRSCARAGADVVALVRGGGSATDLAAFDTEEVIRAVADCPIPVFCGVGHEIDHPLVEEFVYLSTKTPTACAVALIERVQKAEASVHEAYHGILREAEQLLAKNNAEMDLARGRLGIKSRQYLSEAKSDMERKRQQIFFNAERAINQASEEGLRLKEGISSKTKAMLENRKTHIEGSKKDLHSLSQKILKSQRAKVKSSKSLLQAYDPELVLKRGWSITHTIKGDLVVSASNVPEGTDIITRVAKGEIYSHTIKRPAKTDTGK